MKHIPIVEIFGPSVQGEGPNIGQRCIFVRVKGCSFQCKWCDSKHTWNDHDSDCTTYTSEVLGEELVYICQANNCYKVILTGGNPCLYDFTEVISELNTHGIRVDVETQGDLYPAWLDMIDTIVFSPKPPSSGMPDTYDKIVEYIKSHHDDLTTKIAIKIPIFDNDDLEFARKYAKFWNDYRCETAHKIDVKIYLSVGNSDVTTSKSIRDRVLSDHEHLLCVINENPAEFSDVYILPQLHTLVWGNRQGV